MVDQKKIQIEPQCQFWILKSLFHISCFTNDKLWNRTSFIMDKILCIDRTYNNITRVNFIITSTKLYVPVVTLSSNDNIKLLENIKQVLKRTIFWNKYRSEIATQV